MKEVLFISEGTEVDYECDCVYHGLCQLDDLYIETLHDYWYMYKGNSMESLSKLYGMGFSITGRIGKSKQHVVALDIAKNKIINHEYDYIIYGSLYRDQTFLDLVLKHYKKDAIAIIDGDDDNWLPTKISWSYFRHWNTTRWRKKHYKWIVGLSVKTNYFKRELTEKSAKSFLPLSFAIPEENIVNTLPLKERELAFIYPGKKETYIYKTEEDYYKGYKIAKFGVTFKKAGWDCMRHYEILANGCIPYFPDIKQCPERTMVNFPKELIKETNRLYESGNMTNKLYDFYSNELLKYTRTFLTTKKLAQYILSYLK